MLSQAGDSPGGRELAAKHADVVFSADAVRILPGATVVLSEGLE
jgi:alkanesulfonate monooxygenase SsuD/methylene tetrahydromethanopterin reductase-like flavin-dependent oxidoreductase (luciferase family)